jgi:hypothetical protein
MSDQSVTTGWVTDIQGIPGCEGLELISFTPPALNNETGTMTVMKDRQLVNRRGDKSHQGVGTFSITGVLPTDQSSITELRNWVRQCGQEGNEQHQVDVLATVLNGDDPVTEYNFVGCSPASYQEAALTAGDPSPQTFDMTVNVTSYEIVA